MNSVISNLEFGVTTPFKHLPEPLWAENSDSLRDPSVGAAFTDNVCTWLKSGYLCGPFTEPPLPNLRINQVFAVEQPEKFRNIVNMSFPKKRSHNDAIDTTRLPKITMATTRQVGQAVKKAGPSGVMSKLDMKDAYKLLPVHRSELKYQGFMWMGRIFIEKMLVFGNKRAVPAFDNFHESVVNLVRVEAQTKKDNEYRILDDMLHISRSSEENAKFVNKYLEIAEDLNIPLAKLDGKKAFIGKSEGIMLGVFFDAKTQSWALPSDKIQRYMYALQSVVNKKLVSKLELQKVNGIVNFVTLLCPQLRFFRNPLVNDMKKAYITSPVPLSTQSEKTIHFWLHVLFDMTGKTFPLPTMMSFPPPDIYAFCSDAAGYAAADSSPSDIYYNIGTGFAGYLYPASRVFTTGRAFWPKSFITTAFDEDLKAAGNKTTTLELIGWFLPLFHCIDLIKNSHVLLECDNKAAVLAFARGRSKQDRWASTILTAIMEVCLFFNIYLHVEHLKRCTSAASRYADWLSRDDKKGRDLIKKMKATTTFGFPPSLLGWFENPVDDVDLGSRLICDFKAQLDAR